MLFCMIDFNVVNMVAFRDLVPVVQLFYLPRVSSYSESGEKGPLLKQPDVLSSSFCEALAFPESSFTVSSSFKAGFDTPISEMSFRKRLDYA